MSNKIFLNDPDMLLDVNNLRGARGTVMLWVWGGVTSMRAASDAGSSSDASTRGTVSSAGACESSDPGVVAGRAGRAGLTGVTS